MPERRRRVEKIHHPVWYNTGDIEHCEMVEDQGHADGYYFGQITRYLFRQGQKPTESYFTRQRGRRLEDLVLARIEDLNKAHWYVARWLAWKKYGKRIWKIVRKEPEIVFKPELLARKVNGS